MAGRDLEREHRGVLRRSEPSSPCGSTLKLTFEVHLLAVNQSGWLAGLSWC